MRYFLPLNTLFLLIVLRAVRPICVIHSELEAETANQEGHANTNSIAHGK